MEFKTGTTIVGIRYKTGVVLCADTRSTSGPIVADKNCEKIHFISNKIMCCGAGTAADTRRVTRMASKELQLFSYRLLKNPYISHCERIICDYLHSYGGQIGAALVLGGIDLNGPKLFSISPNGYSTSLEFTSMGSGSIAAISVLENEFKKNLSKEEAINLGCKAVKSGILNDLYSGSNVDVCVIDISGVEEFRNYWKVESRKDESEIKYPKDSVMILKEQIFEIVQEVIE
ncbi:MAG: hypothetical protein KC414_14525 [Romboutsia sp.]|nr:hypothetical protein [Romboutsia sp.]